MDGPQAKRTRGEITALLCAWREGDEAALDELVERVHPELRRLAGAHFRKERPGHTLEPTAIVHEVYLRLLGGVDVDWKDRQHFFALVSRLIRRVLVEHARARSAKKRDGIRVTIEEDVATTGPMAVDLVALDQALTRFAEVYPFQAEVVQLRFFGGLTVMEVAEHLEVGHATVDRAWAFAKAWLHRELMGTPTPRSQ